jgi:hypothetical protein
MERKYDIFISYRREGGDKYARTIQQALEKRYRVFLDFDELRDGVFDQRIMDAISGSSVFLLILSKGALDRCVNEKDWVRQEILQAIECGCHIVPVTIVDDGFEGVPSNLPEELQHAVGQHQFSELQMKTLFRASMEQLVKDRIAPFIQQCEQEDDKAGAEIHIEADAPCYLYRFKTFVKELKPNVDNIIRLNPGTYRLSFRSTQFPGIEVTKIYTLATGVFSDFIEVKLNTMINEKKKQLQEEQIKQQASKQVACQSSSKPLVTPKPIAKPTAKGQQQYQLTDKERVVLYRQLGMVNAAKELEGKRKERLGRWGDLYDFFFDFSRLSIASYLVAYAALAILIVILYVNGYYSTFTSSFSDFAFSVVISYVGMRCILKLDIPTDDSEEIKGVISGIFLIPFIVLFSPFFGILIGVLIGIIIDWWLNCIDLHGTYLLYIYFTIAVFTLYSIVYTVIKRKRQK